MDSLLYNQIQSDIVSSMKDRQNDNSVLRLSVLRMVLADMKNRKIEKGSDLNDQEILSILQKAVKTREDSIREYTSAGRDELASKEQDEISILKGYLPEEYSEDELEAFVDSAIENARLDGVDIFSPRSFGVLMKGTLQLTTEHPSKSANGSLISAIIKRKIAQL